MEAARGNRNEANRLAGLIDSRSFGYMSLMQAIYWCTCGAPFDLDATPVFSSMLAGSGLPWPPAKPLNFPLKDW
jgi:adenylate cyclase